MCGLQEEITEPKLIPLELPKNFPMTKRNAAADGPNLPTSSKSKEKLAGLIDLKQGFSGKLQVYSSGAIKLKVGDSLYNVSTITQIVMRQIYYEISFIRGSNSQANTNDDNILLLILGCLTERHSYVANKFRLPNKLFY